MRSILLVGNGINNLQSAYTWSHLVRDLIDFVGATKHIRIAHKPFPLLYEEIVAHAVKEKHIAEAEIKAFIANKIAEFRPNEIHARVMALKLTDVLTTNYDYTLELASGVTDQKTLVNAGVVKENRYSLFRVINTKPTRIWHIHGERKSPNSIALGYEHYSGYLQLMRNYVVMGTAFAYKKHFDSLEKRLKTNTVRYDSWVDFFFTHDVYIIGLNLDFVEMHLWWLLNYRARRTYATHTPQKNRITYFYPAHFASRIRDKLDLLNASDVIPHAIKADGWLTYYQRVLDAIEKASHSN